MVENSNMYQFYQRCVWVACVILLRSLAAAQGISPTNLQCEAKFNPVGISETLPRLSWQDIATTGERGQYQTACQIQVASSLQVLTNNQGDLWDTGQMATNRSSQIVYAGSALTSHQACYWHVQVWDKTGQPSGWSSPASWTIGIRTTGEWTAQWIGRDDGPAWNTGSTFPQAKWIWFPEGNPAVDAGGDPLGSQGVHRAGGRECRPGAGDHNGGQQLCLVCQRTARTVRR